MLKQTIALMALGANLSFYPAVAQSTAGGAAPSHVVQMVNLVANVDKTIHTKKAKAGDPFTAKVTTAGELDDGTNVPAGSVLEGHVDSVTPSENKGDSVLTVTIDKLAIKGGTEIPVKATITHVASFAPITEGKAYSDPSSYQRQYIPSSRPTDMQDPNAPKRPHSIPDLLLTSSPRDATSGTFTCAKKNLDLANTVQLQVSVASAPSGMKIQ